MQTYERKNVGAVDVLNFRVNWVSILNTVPAGAYMCDESGLIVFFNLAAQAIWGRSPLLNHPDHRYCGSLRMYSSDGAEIRHDECWMALALKDGNRYINRRLDIERPDGTRIHVRVHVNPIRSSDGCIVSAINLILLEPVNDIPPYSNAALAMIEVTRSLLALASWPTTRSLTGAPVATGAISRRH